MLEAALHRPALVPDAEDVQVGYELPMQELELLGSRIRLFTFPDGQRDPERTVVCLPGLGASGRSFAPMAPLAQTLRLLLWTPPLETPRRWTPLEWSLETLAAKAAPLPPRFCLLGSSFGSLVALAFALRYPERVRALVLVSPVASVRRVRRWALTLSTLVRVPVPFAYLLAPTVARILGGPLLPPEGRAEIVREARRLSPREMLRRLRDILAADHLAALPGLDVPTLVVHGARDRLIPLRAARDVTRRLGNGSLTVIPTASHLPYMSHAQIFNEAVARFLLPRLD